MRRVRNLVAVLVTAGAVAFAVASAGCGQPGDEAPRSQGSEALQVPREDGSDIDIARAPHESDGTATPPPSCPDGSAPLSLQAVVAEGDLPEVPANLCPEDVNASDSEGRTPLSLAIGIGSKELVRTLIEAGADPNIEVRPDSRAGSHLTYAVGLGNAGIVSLLLAAGADPNFVDTEQFYDQTPLSLAIGAGDEDLVRMLLLAGADPNIEVKPAFRVTGHIDYADRLGHPGIVELLVSETSNESLCYAINFGDLEGARPLIRSGMDIDSRCEVSGQSWYEGAVPLHIATRNGDEAIMQLLVDAGADTNARGSSPLCQLVNYDRVDAVRILVDAGADVDERCQSKSAWYHGTTPTEIASRYERTEILEVLRSQPPSGQSQLATSGSSDPDRDSLESIFQATGGQGWTYSDNWLSDEPLTRWYGVTTNESGRVTELSLYANGLAGSLPAELGDLSELRWIDLSGNRLAGPIPGEIHRLSELRWLNLAENELSGPIDPRMGRLSQLRQLDLSRNQLTGPIPPQLGDLGDLRELYLYSNGLSGRIPPEVGRLSDLKELELQHNELSGQIPPEIGRLSDLRVLAAHGNRLSGEIPAVLGSLGSLAVLLLHDNELTGEIPPEIGNLDGLAVISLHDNRLSGILHDTILELTGLVAATFCEGNSNLACDITNLVTAGVEVGVEAVFGVGGVIGQVLGVSGGQLGHIASSLSGIGGALGSHFGGIFGFW